MGEPRRGCWRLDKKQQLCEEIYINQATENPGTDGGYSPNTNRVKLPDSSLLLRLSHSQPLGSLHPCLSPHTSLRHHSCSQWEPRAPSQCCWHTRPSQQGRLGNSSTTLLVRKKGLTSGLTSPSHPSTDSWLGFKPATSYPQKKPVTAVTAVNCHSSGMQ